MGRYSERYLLTVLAAALSLWLILGFWPLSVGNRVALSLVVILICAGMLWRQRVLARVRDDAVRDIEDDSLPPEDFQGAVILACGDNALCFTAERRHRETRQGWYLKVQSAEQLPLLAQHLSIARPALVSRIAVLLAILPETHRSADDFIQDQRGWQRALAQIRSTLGRMPPVCTVTWISPPAAWPDGEPVWFTLTDPRSGIQVHQPGPGNVPLAEWAQEPDVSGHLSRLSLTLWLESLLAWQTQPARQGERADAIPCAQGICITPVKGLPDNLWQQHITAITALAPPLTESTRPVPLPDLLLSALPRSASLSRMAIFWRRVGLLGGIFLVLAMLASFMNNQRLIRSVGDHLSLYQKLSGEPTAPKLRAQQRLRADAALLDDWLRRGEPQRYRLGLYQGLRLIPMLDAAIGNWAPPVSPASVIKQIVQGPETIRLDSMSLFASGKYDLKTGSTRLLVNALVGIKAKPGWLIVVAGHTDNTGNPQLNQTLSMKRAEAVRDWMRDTGDVPESCFAVQGYGASRPVATNETPEGRGLNRRVEISLLPQANACSLPGEIPASSQDDDASQQNGE